MKANDAVFGVLLMVLAGAILVYVRGFPNIPGQNVGPALYPSLIAVGLGACGVLLTVRGVRERGRAGAAWVARGGWLSHPRRVLAFGVVVVGSVAFIALADVLGFLVIAPLFLAALLWAFGTRQAVVWPTAIVVALAMHFAFYKLLRVPLPWGVLKGWAY